MTPLFGSRQRAEEFAALVDARTSVPAAGSAATEQLLRVADLLRAPGGPRTDVLPSDEFTTELREMLMAEAASMGGAPPVAAPARTRGRRERRLAAVAACAVMLAGTASVANAAQQALPGDALYPVKRGLERADVRLSTSPAGRGQDLLDQATGRLEEVKGLIDQDAATDGPLVTATIESFTVQAHEGADLMMSSYRETGDPKTILSVRQFAATGMDSIEAIQGAAPTATLPGLFEAENAVRGIDNGAGQLCEACADLPVLSPPADHPATADQDPAMPRPPTVGLDDGLTGESEDKDLPRADGSVPGTGAVKQKPTETSPATHSSPSVQDPLPTPQPATPPSTGSSEPEVEVVVPDTGTTTEEPTDEQTDDPTDHVTEDLGDVVASILPTPDGGLLDAGHTDK